MTEFKPGDRVRIKDRPDVKGKALSASLTIKDTLLVQLHTGACVVQWPEQLEHDTPSWDDVRVGDVITWRGPLELTHDSIVRGSDDIAWWLRLGRGYYSLHRAYAAERCTLVSIERPEGER